MKGLVVVSKNLSEQVDSVITLERKNETRMNDRNLGVGKSTASFTVQQYCHRNGMWLSSRSQYKYVRFIGHVIKVRVVVFEYL